jgi:hypothetical protein
MCTFTLESMHFIFNKCPIYTDDGTSAKFSTNSHETDYSGSALLCTVKKGKRFSRPPSRNLTNQTLPGLDFKLFPARDGLLSDIPAGDGKTANLFLQCRSSPGSYLTAAGALTNERRHNPR